MTSKSETLTIRLDPDLRELLETTIEAMPYRPTITSVVERGLVLAINELEKMMSAAEIDQADAGSDQVKLRLPAGLRDRIKAVAKKNGRSMNQEILQVLNQFFPAE